MEITNHYRNRQERELESREVDALLETEGTIFYGEDLDTECRVSIVNASGKTYYGEGFAFLRPGDHYDRTIGEQLAYCRATIEALEDMEIDIISGAGEQYAKEGEEGHCANFCDRISKPFPDNRVGCDESGKLPRL